MSTQNTASELYAHLKDLSGQDGLSATRANRLLKYAMDDYSHIALVSDGVHKFDDITHENAEGDPTYPIATAVISPTSYKIPLELSFLMLDRVALVEGDVETPLEAIDRRDYKNQSLVSAFGASGKPRVYDYDAHAIEAFPHPDASYTVRAYYSRACRYIDVSNAVDEIGIPAIHHFYLILHCMRQLGFKIIDANRVDVNNELAKWEGVDGKGGKIREFFQKRDEDRPRRLKPKPEGAFSRAFNRR